MSNRVTFEFILRNSAFKRAGREVAATNRKIENSLRGMKAQAVSAGASLKSALGFAGAAGFVVGVSSAVRSFADLEKGVTNVVTLLDSDKMDSGRTQIDAIARSAIKMGFSIDDSTKALFNQVSAMGLGAQTAETFEVAQKLAIGGVTSLATSVSGISAVVNTYGADVASASDVANAFFTAQKFGTTDVERLANTVGQVAPSAKLAGVGFKELLATMAQLTQGGLSQELAATALKAAISGLTNPADNARAALVRMGVPVGASQIQAAGFTETLLKLQEAVQEYGIDALSEAIPNIRAFTAVGTLQRKELERVDMIVKQMNQDIAVGTGLNEAAAKQMETLTFAMGRAGGSVSLIGASIGEGLAPVVRLVARLLEDLILGTAVLAENVLFPIMAMIVDAIDSVVSFISTPWVVGLQASGFDQMFKDFFANIGGDSTGKSITDITVFVKPEAGASASVTSQSSGGTKVNTGLAVEGAGA